MINKYWDLKNVSLSTTEVQEGDLIAYGATKPPDDGTRIC